MTNEMRAYFDQKFNDLASQFNHMKTDMGHMKTEMGQVKTDMGHMKTEMGEMNAKIETLTKIQLRMEHNHGGKLAAIFDKLDQFEKHIQNKTIHVNPYI